MIEENDNQEDEWKNRPRSGKDYGNIVMVGIGTFLIVVAAVVLVVWALLRV